MERRYLFSWELLGGLSEGRPTLGRYARLEAYRLMQYTMRDVLEERLGTQQAEGLFYQAGQLAGREFFQHMIGETHEGQWLLRRLQQVLREMGLGLLHLEEAAPDIFHLHSWTSGAGLGHLRQVARMGIPSIVTMHVPSALCMRGTMLLYGKRACDGRIDARRCARCCRA